MQYNQVFMASVTPPPINLFRLNNIITIYMYKITHMISTFKKLFDKIKFHF